MHGLRKTMADARHRPEQVGARTQVRDLAQELQRMRLGLDRVGFRVFHPADDFDAVGLDLEALALALRRHQRAAGDHGATGGQVGDLIGVVGQGVRRHHLDRIEAAAIRHIDEAEASLGIATGANPTPDADLAVGGDLARQRLFDAYYVDGARAHEPLSPAFWGRPGFPAGIKTNRE